MPDNTFTPAPEPPALALVAADFDCPTCGVKAGHPCVTRAGKLTKAHAERGGPNAS